MGIFVCFLFFILWFWFSKGGWSHFICSRIFLSKTKRLPLVYLELWAVYQAGGLIAMLVSVWAVPRPRQVFHPNVVLSWSCHTVSTIYICLKRELTKVCRFLCGGTCPRPEAHTSWTHENSLTPSPTRKLCLRSGRRSEATWHIFTLLASRSPEWKSVLARTHRKSPTRVDDGW